MREPPDMEEGRATHPALREAATGKQLARGHHSDHDVYMRQLQARIDWLETHEHWWLRQLRWQREGRDAA